MTPYRVNRTEKVVHALLFRHLFFVVALFVVIWSMKFLKNVAGFGWRTLHSSVALLSVVGAIGRASLKKEVGLPKPEPRGSKVLQRQVARWWAGGTEYPRWWHRQGGQQQFCSDLWNWQICHVQFCHDKRLGKWFWRNWIYRNAAPGAKIWSYVTIQTFLFLYNPFSPDFFNQFHLKSNDSIWSHKDRKGNTCTILETPFSYNSVICRHIKREIS